MCIFTGDIEAVSDTRIFCRGESGHQYCVYEMQLSTPAETAMVLPVPIAPGSGDDALRFINLEDYPAFFDDLDDMFPAIEMALALPGAAAPASVLEETLEVHRVGAFEASFVPSIADFERLDRRFRLAPELWAALPQVKRDGFAVFKLAAGRGQQIHPMAFVYPARDPGKLVFPTIHVHDGKVHEVAQFDHALFCQSGRPYAPAECEPATIDDQHELLAYWEVSSGLAGDALEVERTGGIVAAAERCYRRIVNGSFTNRDIVLDLSSPA